MIIAVIYLAVYLLTVILAPKISCKALKYERAVITVAFKEEPLTIKST